MPIIISVYMWSIIVGLYNEHPGEVTVGLGYRQFTPLRIIDTARNLPFLLKWNLTFSRIWIYHMGHINISLGRIKPTGEFHPLIVFTLSLLIVPSHTVLSPPCCLPLIPSPYWLSMLIHSLAHIHYHFLSTTHFLPFTFPLLSPILLFPIPFSLSVNTTCRINS